MLRDYCISIKGKTNYSEINCDKDVLSQMIIDYKNSTKKINIEGLYEYIREQGYRIDEYNSDITIDDDYLEYMFNLDIHNEELNIEVLRLELKQLIEQDYKIRNIEPQYIVHDDKITIYSLINGSLCEDCEFEPLKFNYSIDEIEGILIKNGFKKL